MQKWRMSNVHRGALKFICCWLAFCQKGLSTIQQEERLSSVMMLNVSQRLLSSWRGQRTYFSFQTWLEWRSEGCCWCCKRQRLFVSRRYANVRWKQISPCSRAQGLKIPQTGYEALCWGWRPQTSDKRMCSINATVARKRERKRGRRVLEGWHLSWMADKRQHLSDTGTLLGFKIAPRKDL